MFVFPQYWHYFLQVIRLVFCAKPANLRLSISSWSVEAEFMDQQFSFIILSTELTSYQATLLCIFVVHIWPKVLCIEWVNTFNLTIRESTVTNTFILHNSLNSFHQRVLVLSILLEVKSLTFFHLAIVPHKRLSATCRAIRKSLSLKTKPLAVLLVRIERL